MCFYSVLCAKGPAGVLSGMRLQDSHAHTLRTPLWAPHGRASPSSDTDTDMTGSSCPWCLGDGHLRLKPLPSPTPVPLAFPEGKGGASVSGPEAEGLQAEV